MTTESLIRLIYYSEPQKSMSNDDIDEILKISRENNQKNNVTGVLFFGGADLIQVLEGEESMVIKLYAKIIDDPRHKNCQLLDINFEQERFFSEWAMGYTPQEHVDVARLKAKLSNHQKTHQKSLSEVSVLLRTYLGKIV